MRPPRGYSKRNSRAIEEMLGLFPPPLNSTTTQPNSIKHEFKIEIKNKEIVIFIKTIIMLTLSLFLKKVSSEICTDLCHMNSLSSII